MQKVEWLSRYLKILDLKKKYSNYFGVKNDKIQSSIPKLISSEIPFESKSKALIQYDKKTEIMEIFYRQSKKSVSMDEDMFREFHTLLERKLKQDFKKKKNEKIEDILSLLKKMQADASAVISESVN